MSASMSLPRRKATNGQNRPQFAGDAPPAPALDAPPAPVLASPSTGTSRLWKRTTMDGHKTFVSGKRVYMSRAIRDVLGLDTPRSARIATIGVRVDVNGCPSSEVLQCKLTRDWVSGITEISRVPGLRLESIVLADSVMSMSFVAWVG